MIARAVTQAELEAEISVESRQRALRMMDKNEKSGNAHNNPYASAIYRRWLLPLRDLITEAVKPTGKAGRLQAHVALLRPLDPAAVAYITVRSVLSGVMRGELDARAFGRIVGRAVYEELVLATFEHINPELFWEISHDLERKNSKSADHRYRAMRATANSHGIEVPDWAVVDREQVGLYLIDCLRVLGMVDVGRRLISGFGRKKPTTEFSVSLSEAATKAVDDIKEVVEVTMPIQTPFIEPPKPWTSLGEGGYHTPEMRRTLPHCINLVRVKSKAVREDIGKADLSQVMSAINALQCVQWRVNEWLLDTVRDLSRHGIDIDEVLAQGELPRPPRPGWLNSYDRTLTKDDKDTLTTEQLNEFANWKRHMASWHTQMKLRGTRWGRFYSATRMAERFRHYNEIYFLYQADFRGRLYAMTTGINPQGSDLQKALLHFAYGKPLNDERAVFWFKVNGANKFGIDKVPFEERIKWVDDNERFIIEFATDPVSNQGWTSADCPLQFLAWCREFALWRSSPSNFVSRIPVGLDGSCNGLQHFSAMLRDSVGGRATNLIDAGRPNDIYQQVADRVQARLHDLKTDSLSERDLVLRSKWLAHGMNRSIVKRSVMTLPYGSTRYSCAEFVVEDYLRHGKAVEFEQNEYVAAGNFLSHLIWEAIGEVVVAAAEAMEWLQKSAVSLIKSGEQYIKWTAPSGFPVVQSYIDIDIITARSLLLGGVRINIGRYNGKPDAKQHKNGLAPNFVHSMDASHLTITVNECSQAGLSGLAMIHDDYGTHAADAEKLYQLIRKTFVRMYEENDPLVDFRRCYDGLPAAPQSGDLDIKSVLKSKFFFA